MNHSNYLQSWLTQLSRNVYVQFKILRCELGIQYNVLREFEEKNNNHNNKIYNMKKFFKINIMSATLYLYQPIGSSFNLGRQNTTKNPQFSLRHLYIVMRYIPHEKLWPPSTTATCSNALHLNDIL